MRGTEAATTLSADGVFRVVVLRPSSWIEEQGAKVGGAVSITLGEWGVLANARVAAIEPCPEIRPGSGRVVLMKTESASTEVVEVHVAGLATPIGVTSRHPIWSVTRRAWVEAGRLEPGEFVSTTSDSATIQRVLRHPGRHVVYNLEVESEHVYRVTALGILCHNDSARPTKPTDEPGDVHPTAAERQAERGIDAAEVERTGFPADQRDGREVFIGANGDVLIKEEGKPWTVMHMSSKQIQAKFDSGEWTARGAPTEGPPRPPRRTGR